MAVIYDMEQSPKERVPEEFSCFEPGNTTSLFKEISSFHAYYMNFRLYSYKRVRFIV